MKTLNKALVSIGLLMGSTSALAEPMIIDLSAIGMPADPIPFLNSDGDAKTDPFDSLLIDSNASNVSTYVDDNGTAGIQDFDTVYDSVTDQGLSMDPTGDSHATEIFGGAWTMNIDYYLEGFTLVVPDLVDPDPNYVGVFTEGWANIDIYDALSDTMHDDVMEMEFVSGTTSAISEGDSAVTFTFKLTSVLSGLFLNSSGTDLADLLEDDVMVRFSANADLTDQGNAPTFSHHDGTHDIYTRETSLGSIDLRLVPEPSSLAAFAVLLLGFVGVSRFSKSKS